MAGPLTYDQAARELAKREFEEVQRKMAEEVGDAMPAVTSEEEADSIAVEWVTGENEKRNSPDRPAPTSPACDAD